MSNGIPQRGEVYWFDLRDTQGSEPNKVRPVLVLQTDWVRGLETFLAVPLTSRQERVAQPTGIFVSKDETGLDKDSVALCHLLSAWDRSRICAQVPGATGRVSDLTIDRVLSVVTLLLGVDPLAMLEAEADEGDE